MGYSCRLCPPQELAGGPPGGFKLEETAGDTQLSLTKIFKDEEISVDLMVNNQVGGGCVKVT